MKHLFLLFTLALISACAPKKDGFCSTLSVPWVSQIIKINQTSSATNKTINLNVAFGVCDEKGFAANFVPVVYGDDLYSNFRVMVYRESSLQTLLSVHPVDVTTYPNYSFPTLMPPEFTGKLYLLLQYTKSNRSGSQQEILNSSVTEITVD